MLSCSGEKHRFIIDRSIPEIFRQNKYVREEVIWKYCVYLRNVGVDYVEIDKNVLGTVNPAVPGLEFIYRINDLSDPVWCENQNTGYCVIADNIVLSTDLSAKVQDWINRVKVKTIVEVEINHLSDLSKLKKMGETVDLGRVSSIRLRSSCLNRKAELLAVISLIKERYGVKIDVCPENRFHMATAIALEASCIADVDYITTAFTGRGGEAGFAPLEELLVALKVIRNINVYGDCSKMAGLAQIYKKLTGKAMLPLKPIIGADIFKYESGIHADGIEKNPATYEPFEPGLVGKQREMVLGKHSGSGSVSTRLNELGLNSASYNLNEILEQIRARSIKMKRSVRNHELIDICQRAGKTTPTK